MDASPPQIAGGDLMWLTTFCIMSVISAAGLGVMAWGIWFEDQ